MQKTSVGGTWLQIQKRLSALSLVGVFLVGSSGCWHLLTQESAMAGLFRVKERLFACNPGLRMMKPSTTSTVSTRPGQVHRLLHRRQWTSPNPSSATISATKPKGCHQGGRLHGPGPHPFPGWVRRRVTTTSSTTSPRS